MGRVQNSSEKKILLGSNKTQNLELVM